MMVKMKMKRNSLDRQLLMYRLANYIYHISISFIFANNNSEFPSKLTSYIDNI